MYDRENDLRAKYYGSQNSNIHCQPTVKSTKKNKAKIIDYYLAAIETTNNYEP
jgi:hypothetical protein